MNSTPDSIPWGKIAAHPMSLHMILHKCHEYYRFCDDLSDLMNQIGQIKEDEEPDESEFKPASELAGKAHSLLVSLGDVNSTVLEHVQDIAQHFGEISSGLNGSYIMGHLETIRRMVESELASHFFLLIPSPQDKMVRNEKPFGPQVFDAFPSAQQDLTDANTAFAMELYTACVFHLVRSVEYAMRVLAWDRRVKVKTKGGQVYPIDLATWEEILRELDKEVAKVAQWPKTKGDIRVQATEFYGTALEEIRGFKDAWRNHIMHSRRQYIEEDAAQVRSHVQRFMTTLALRISEHVRTPKVWTSAELR